MGRKPNMKPAKRRWSEYDRSVIRSYLCDAELMAQNAIAKQTDRAADDTTRSAEHNIHWWRDVQRVIRWMLSQVRD